MSPAPNAAGWHRGDVTVSWNWIDGASGIDAAHCPDRTTTNRQGRRTLTATCRDRAGNRTTASRTVRVDTTAPTVTINAPSGRRYVQGTVVRSDFTCRDGISGIASCRGTTPDGAGIDTFTRGRHRYTVVAQDRAGNHRLAAVTYTVVAPPACAGRRATIVGTSGAEVLTGTSGADVIASGGGADVISGGSGDDTICAGAGADTVDGGDGGDLIAGSGGDDALLGLAGNDHLDGGPGTDACHGGPGTDRVHACESRDRHPMSHTGCDPTTQHRSTNVNGDTRWRRRLIGAALAPTLALAIASTGRAEPIHALSMGATTPPTDVGETNSSIGTANVAAAEDGTWCNEQPITVPSGGASNPYPSTITVDSDVHHPYRRHGRPARRQPTRTPAIST